LKNKNPINEEEAVTLLVQGEEETIIYQPYEII